MKPGTRITTPTGRTGTTQRPPFQNPLYTLVKLDDGKRYWYLIEILTEGEPPTPPRKKRSKARKAKARV